LQAEWAAGRIIDAWLRILVRAPRNGVSNAAIDALQLPRVDRQIVALKVIELADKVAAIARIAVRTRVAWGFGRPHDRLRRSSLSDRYGPQLIVRPAWSGWGQSYFTLKRLTG
jgi:hypothetical protein